MANGFVIFGRFISILLCIAQTILLIQFPIKYENSKYYWLLLSLCIPAVIALSLWYTSGCDLRYVWPVWLLYIVFLIITAVVVYCLVGHQLSEDRPFGPHVFEMSLCISPVLLFLLLNVASDSKKDRGQLILISFRIMLDLFDGVEMLGVTLDKAGRPRDGVPQEMQIVIAVFVLVVFGLSSFELREQTSDDANEHDCLFGIHAFLHMLVNGAFLILRLILWIKFERPAPIFIAKSGLSFMVCIIEMAQCCC